MTHSSGSQSFSVPKKLKKNAIHVPKRVNQFNFSKKKIWGKIGGKSIRIEFYWNNIFRDIKYILFHRSFCCSKEKCKLNFSQSLDRKDTRLSCYIDGELESKICFFIFWIWLACLMFVFSSKIHSIFFLLVTCTPSWSYHWITAGLSILLLIFCWSTTQLIDSSFFRHWLYAAIRGAELKK